MEPVIGKLVVYKHMGADGAPTYTPALISQVHTATMVDLIIGEVVVTVVRGNQLYQWNWAMPHLPPAPLTIKVAKRESDFKAWLASDPAAWDRGDSVDAAIGALVRSHPRRFGAALDIDYSWLSKELAAAKRERATTLRTTTTLPPSEPGLSDA